MKSLGEVINVVCPAPWPCPSGHAHSRLDVCEHGVVWPCGEVRSLPPLPAIRTSGIPRGPRRPR